jgi:hypothetical protein
MMRDANKCMDDIFMFLSFFEQLSYKIICISIYGSKDMILARYNIFCNFQKNRIRPGAFLTHEQPATDNDKRARES